MTSGNASVVGCAGSGLPVPAQPTRVVRRFRLRAAVAFALKWLSAFSSSDTPDTISSLSMGTSRPSSTTEQSAFEQLFARYRQPLLDYLYGMTRDRPLAEDLVQETFLRAYAAQKTTAVTVTYPQAWLYRIATNIALDVSRRQRQISWLPLQRVEPEAGPRDADTRFESLPDTALQADFVASIVERDAVWHVLDELPPRWRAVLLLQATAGFGVRDIGSMLHLTDANIRKILFRAKERFRAIYTQQDTGETSGGRP